MIDVALLRVIRRWRLRGGLASREIARRTDAKLSGLTRAFIDNEAKPVTDAELVVRSHSGAAGQKQQYREHAQRQGVGSA